MLFLRDAKVVVVAVAVAGVVAVRAAVAAVGVERTMRNEGRERLDTGVLNQTARV